jgi:hypothetical protein
MVLGWLLLGMRYFGKAEGWTMVEAFYFGIVTLTTIGFGDYVPTTPAGDAFHFLFCIFGLGLVATLLGALSALAAGGDDGAGVVGFAVDDAAFDAGHERRDFHGETHAVAALTDLEVFNRTGGGMRLRRFFKRNGEVFWMRKNIQEPACESGNTDENADESDKKAGHQAGEEEHQTKCGDDGPAGRLGNFDEFWVFRVRSIHCGTRTLRM